jgi:hypothetical protein
MKSRTNLFFLHLNIPILHDITMLSTLRNKGYLIFRTLAPVSSLLPRFLLSYSPAQPSRSPTCPHHTPKDPNPLPHYERQQTKKPSILPLQHPSHQQHLSPYPIPQFAINFTYLGYTRTSRSATPNTLISTLYTQQSKHTLISSYPIPIPHSSQLKHHIRSSHRKSINKGGSRFDLYHSVDLCYFFQRLQSCRKRLSGRSSCWYLSRLDLLFPRVGILVWYMISVHNLSDGEAEADK